MCRAIAADQFIDQFVNRPRKQVPAELILDLDALDPIHGMQEGRFFHGYYDFYCYLPLYIFCGSELLCAKLRPANIDGAAGSLEEVERIVSALRKKWPEVRIILRGDKGFRREELMVWCEGNEIDYICSFHGQSSRPANGLSANAVLPIAIKS